MSVNNKVKLCGYSIVISPESGVKEFGAYDLIGIQFQCEGKTYQ